MRFFIFLFALFSFVNAESIGDAAKKAYLANINAIMIFTSHDGLNSGLYRFTDADAEMRILHLPLIYHFEPFEEHWNLFFLGGVGYSETKITSQVQSPLQQNNIELTMENMLRTYTIGAGFGVRYRTEFDLDVLFGAEVIYSRVNITLRDTDDEVGDLIGSFLDGNDNFSYKYMFQLFYQKEFRGFKPYAKLDFAWYKTNTDFNILDLASLSTQSSVTSVNIGAESPKLYAYDGMYMTMEGYINGNYLGGDITGVAKLSSYGELGAVAYWYTENKPFGIRRYFFELNKINGKGLDGYNMGIGFSVDF
ncbi:MAG: hypothetical protein B5M52_07170 [Helicobacteraceae bacterium 4484_230]|nr:MAG: hypothetical protein B5M52_07170 [Helicobacteraceae bacterium 4484_230]